jgi:hypothetical protein
MVTVVAIMFAVVVAFAIALFARFSTGSAKQYANLHNDNPLSRELTIPVGREDYDLRADSRPLDNPAVKVSRLRSSIGNW